MKKITLIGSAYRANNNLLDNTLATNKLIGELNRRGLQSFQAVGSYKEDGQETASQEVSRVVEIKEVELDSLKRLFFEDFNQDAVLIIDENNSRQSSLHFNDGSVIELGNFQVIDKEEALSSECYTYFDNKFYLAKWSINCLTAKEKWNVQSSY